VNGCRGAGGGKRTKLRGKEKSEDSAKIKIALVEGGRIQRILTQLQH